MNGLLKVLSLILTLFAKSVKSSQEAPQKKETPRVPPTNPECQILFKNDSERLKRELDELKTKNFGLYRIIMDICAYCDVAWNKTVVITMIYRTEQEQDDIYKDDPKYQIKKFKSPHNFYHAFDMRSSTFDTKQIEELVNYINSSYNESNYYKWSAKCHTVGIGAEHFHVQFVKKEN